jgi:DNA-binding CsgD family transcriptional regulator
MGGLGGGMRIDAEALDKVSDEFLNAAIDPSLWQGTVEKLAVASGAFGMNIVPIVGRFRETVIATDSLGEAMNAYFGEEWHTRDFRADHLASHIKRSGVVVEQDFASAEDFERLDYYRSMAQFGLRWTALMTVSSGDDLVAFVMQRKIEQGPFEADEVALFRKVRQKLMISASVMKGVSDARAGGISEAFNTANVGCIFFDRTGKVVGVNEKARTFLGVHLQVTNGRLRSSRSNETADLNSRLNSVLHGGISFRADMSDVVLVTRGDKRPLVVRMQRLAGNILDLFGNCVAMALIADLDERLPPNLSLLCKLFDLTPREAEIASMMAVGGSLVEIGEGLGISYQTIRTHVQGIYRKTDTGSQGLLVALLNNIRL